MTSAAPSRMDAPSEPLWAPTLIVCMAVSLAVFVLALFAARAGASNRESAPVPACVSSSSEAQCR